MTASVDVLVRQAVSADQRQIANLIHFSPHLHCHLDWRYPLDWIGSSPFYVLENRGQLAAALACPPDPPLVAWMRLFVSSGKISVNESWQILWNAARLDLCRKGRFIVAAIVLQDWYQDLLVASGFVSCQSIVMLERDGECSSVVSLPIGFSIRPMRPQDLPVVAKVDSAAFGLLWQNSLFTLKQAFPQAMLTSVAEADGQVVGYQISTRNSLGIHLARLAVRPEAQRRGIGYALVVDLIQQAERRGITHLTVNTQSDNTVSSILYQRAGFHETGERYPVYQMIIP